MFLSSDQILNTDLQKAKFASRSQVTEQDGSYILYLDLERECDVCVDAYEFSSDLRDSGGSSASLVERNGFNLGQSRCDQHQLARSINAFRRMLRSSSDRAPSAPTTGSLPRSRSPSCTSTDAWSQYRCSCTILSPSNWTTTTNATSTRLPVGGMAGNIQSIEIV